MVSPGTPFEIKLDSAVNTRLPPWRPKNVTTTNLESGECENNNGMVRLLGKSLNLMVDTSETYLITFEKAKELPVVVVKKKNESFNIPLELYVKFRVKEGGQLRIKPSGTHRFIDECSLIPLYGNVSNSKVFRNEYIKVDPGQNPLIEIYGKLPEGQPVNGHLDFTIRGSIKRDVASIASTPGVQKITAKI
jgi:hypothetical protein